MYNKGLSLRQTEQTTSRSVYQDPASYEEYLSKTKDALQSPGCHIPCSLCFGEPAALLPQHKLVTHPPRARRSSHARCVCSPTRASQSPLTPRAGLCFPDPAPQTRVTGLSQPQLLGAVSFSLLGTSRRHGANATPSRRKRPQSSHTN